MDLPLDPLRAAFANHPRSFDGFRHIYPVLSRRSGGLSIGVNLNLDRLCNFDCPYCQVDRRVPSPRLAVEPARVVEELRAMLGRYAATGLAETFPGVAPSDRRLRDIALSGDGEPTLEPAFPEVCRQLAILQEAWTAAGGESFTLVCITNATMLDRDDVLRGLIALCAHQGEVWGKLDAGTEDWYHLVNESRVPLDRIEANLKAAAAVVPVRIQSLWMTYRDRSPDRAETDAWLRRIEAIHLAAPLRGVQIHTVARATARSGCRPLPLDWLEELGDRVRALGIDAEVRGGMDSGAITDHAP